MNASADQTLLFVGDSITDAGRSEARPLGDGYVARVAERLDAEPSGWHPTVLNRGVSGDTTRDLLQRWERDVLAAHPDWLVVAIGVNDAWRHFQPGLQHEAVSLAAFEANYSRLLQACRAATAARLLLCEPFVLRTEPRDPLRALLDTYRAAVKDLARAHGAVLVPFQEAFDRVLPTSRPGAWGAPDGVHPNAAGHALLAETVLAAIGDGTGT